MEKPYLDDKDLLCYNPFHKARHHDQSGAEDGTQEVDQKSKAKTAQENE